MIKKEKLIDLYIEKHKSVTSIAKELGCSNNQIDYWIAKYGIKKRNISDALYNYHNPNGDPFILSKIESIQKAFVYGVGLGLYWGEGTKASLCSVRIGNSDSRLIKMFIQFLEEIYSIDRNKLKFGLQIFGDLSVQDEKDYWIKELNISEKQFQKVVISEVRGNGTYKRRLQHGVMTLYFNNTKLRNILINSIERLPKM